MRVLIITAAGMAVRFNKDLCQETAKCIYYENSPKNSLLYQLCLKADDCDKIIIVSGYQSEAIDKYIKANMSSFVAKIQMVFNPKFNTYGSGYSFMLGLEASRKLNPDEIIFVEGDLYFDNDSFKKIIFSKKDIMAINTKPIKADKSVVIYEDTKRHIKYIYDARHNALNIMEPFLAVYNSAQIWKFANPMRIYDIVKNLSQKQIESSNLEIVNKYFSANAIEEIEIVTMHDWINCNTINDYKEMLDKINNIDDRGI
ncbi:MAG: licC domain protein [Elusimicrobiota bacterium]|jgi:choline kinase|nr:licC domain protein [Elusimicrobiota bacterium]